MTTEELRKLDDLVQNFNAIYFEDRTLAQFVRSAAKMNQIHKDDVTVKMVAEELDYIGDIMRDRDRLNTW
jgi:hypothetical protein